MNADEQGQGDGSQASVCGSAQPCSAAGLTIV